MTIISAGDFWEMDDEEKRNFISAALKEDMTKELTKGCLVAMLMYQTERLDEAYEAFCYEQACEAGNFD